MFTTKQLAAVAILAVCLLALLAGKPAGDASVSPPEAKARESHGVIPEPARAPGVQKAEEIFAARYAAYYEKGIYPGLPVTMCEARLLACRGLDFAACRESCRQACGLR
ncbi:hypothetical protein [Desulfolutivibrio sulfoxidireducens]|uniref:hypothetical protein n=1 Tax=Desulfolutivibrio sulfoxidireducens TaxID=2773299 RepID=UPI00159EA6EB|nr:hypothetical protein [Desulfolutivibrio sulfoxidireducens]QLA17553.1 hypothetical protein GD605_16435 [Desulfolutivibrio sulfoxidireducens]QLA21135.1 hypothetical protein GD604_16090 [Desulfolutivibrio sulfoxidireducens]